MTGSRCFNTTRRVKECCPSAASHTIKIKKGANAPSIAYNFKPTTSDLNKKSEVGNFLLSQEAALQVPSADTRLTAGFGMFPGIPTLLWSPTSLFYVQNFFMRSFQNSSFLLLTSSFTICSLSSSSIFRSGRLPCSLHHAKAFDH